MGDVLRDISEDSRLWTLGISRPSAPDRLPFPRKAEMPAGCRTQAKGALPHASLPRAYNRYINGGSAPAGSAERGRTSRYTAGCLPRRIAILWARGPWWVSQRAAPARLKYRGDCPAGGGFRPRLARVSVVGACPSLALTATGAARSTFRTTPLLHLLFRRRRRGLPARPSSGGSLPPPAPFPHPWALRLLAWCTVPSLLSHPPWPSWRGLYRRPLASASRWLLLSEGGWFSTRGAASSLQVPAGRPATPPGGRP